MGSGLSKQALIQSQLTQVNNHLTNKNATTSPPQTQNNTQKPAVPMKKIRSEPALPTMREAGVESPRDENDNKENKPIAPAPSIGQILFPYMHSSPDLLQRQKSTVKSPLPTKKEIHARIMQPPISEMSYRRGERNYFLQSTGNARKGSWKEMELAAMISKPFTGNLRAVSHKKTKLKNVKSIPVISPRNPN